MIDYFNFALLPESENLSLACLDLAQKNFADKADGYLLGESVLPHITLCQFEWQAELEQLRLLWRSMQNLDLAPVELKFEHLYIKPGTAMHRGKYWIGLAVKLVATLAQLQRSVYEELEKLGIQGKTLPEAYFPHLTLARCHYTEPPHLTFMPPEEFWSDEYGFVLSLGRSDENGVYRERLYYV